MLLHDQAECSGTFSRSFSWAGYLLGFSFGGFFDGILLHQILQWHHLLSSLEAEPFRNLRIQILADGGFHALMYVIAGAGLYKLSKTRQEFAEAGANLRLLADFLLGFGVWHIVDAIFSHWLLGLHRIRPGSDNVLFWDLVFFAFGIIAVIVGILIRNRKYVASFRGVSALSLTVLVISAGIGAAVPWKNTNIVTVVFKEDVSMNDVFNAFDAVDGRTVWSNQTNDIWVLHVTDTRQAWKLYAHGAWFVGGSFLGMGCFTSSPPKKA